MSLLDVFTHAFSRRRLQWQLFHDNLVMECVVIDVPPQAAEIRFNYCGELYYSSLISSRQDAEEEARRKRRELIAVGWNERRHAGCEELHAG